MAKYKLPDGNVICADQDFIDAHHPDAVLILETPTSLANAARILSKIDYMNRFTDAELGAIYTAAKTNVSVEIWLEKFRLASDINLDDPRTVAGLQAMEGGGLLAAGRVATILA